MDGSKEEITLVTKTVQLGNLSRDEMLVEHISEDYANPHEIVFITPAVRIGNGIYKYNDPEELNYVSYYLKKNLPLDDVESFSTILLKAKVSDEMAAATGGSILSIDGDFSFKSLLIFLIILMRL